MNYFEFYQLPESFHPDQALVRKRFYELSKQYHPDFFVNEPEDKQQEILELSTLNNKAYQVLSDNRKRTEYVLQLHGLIGEDDKYALPADFLMEMMEINETIMDLQMDPDAAAAASLRQEFSTIKSDLDSGMDELTARYDRETGERKSLLESIRDSWYRQKYLLRIAENLKNLQ